MPCWHPCLRHDIVQRMSLANTVSTFEPYLRSLLRIVVGFTFSLHGYQKFFGWLGIEDITYIPVIHNPAHGDAEAQAKRAEVAVSRLKDTAARWKSLPILSTSWILTASNCVWLSSLNMLPRKFERFIPRRRIYGSNGQIQRCALRSSVNWKREELTSIN